MAWVRELDPDDRAILVDLLNRKPDPFEADADEDGRGDAGDDWPELPEPGEL